MSTDSVLHHGALLFNVHRDLMSGDGSFPTSLRLAHRIKQALDNPRSGTREVATLINAEPVITAKLLRLANCVTFNPRGQAIYGVEQAINRLGFNAVRSLALSVAMLQLKSAPTHAVFRQLSDAAWSRSIRRAALCKSLAQPLNWPDQDEALLCGLVAELSVLYLLHRAWTFPAYQQHPEALHHLITHHSSTINSLLLDCLGLSAPLIMAIQRWSARSQPRSGLVQILDESDRLLTLPAEQWASDPQADSLQQSKAILKDLESALGP